MSPVQDDPRTALDGLQPPLPAGFPDPLDDPAFLEPPPAATDLDRGGDGHSRVPSLVFPPQLGRKDKVLAFEAEREPVAALLSPCLKSPGFVKDGPERRSQLPGPPVDNMPCYPRSQAADHGNARLDDPCFLEGDLGQSLAEKFLMVPAHRRDNRNEGRDDVRGVQPSSHSHFEDGDVHIPFAEIEQGQNGQNLEIGRRGPQVPRGDEFVDHGLQAAEQAAKITPGNGYIPDPDPFLDSNQMGRCVQASAEAVPAEDPGQHGADRALAVGACHQDRGIGKVRFAE